MIKKEDILKKLNFKSFTDFQEEVFLKYKQNTNLLISSKTGSGKTYAYAVPIYLECQNKKRDTLIILPTNELLYQVSNMIEKICDEKTKVLVIDNKTMDKDILKYNNYKESLFIILTPDKFFLLKDKGFNLKNIQTVVYDECDMLFENDFLMKTKEIFLFFKGKKQIIVSATLATNATPFIKENIGSFIKIGDKNRFQGQNHFLLPSEKKDESLVKLIKAINPYLCFIFTQKKENVYQIYNLLKDLNKEITYISSDDKRENRTKKLKEIAKLKHQFVITTDLLARGIDFDITDIINYDIPNNLEYFIHRSGRTARMGKTGNIYTIYSEAEQRKITNLKNKGIVFKQIKITNGEIEVFKKKTKTLSELEIKEIRKIRKPKKVSPNYKKKNKEKIKKALKKAKTKMFRERMKKGR